MRNATFESSQGHTYMMLAGALRNSGSGWHVIDDAAHEPLGISIGDVTSTSIEILYPLAAQVCHLTVGPDETFASPPYKADFGASVGLARSVITGTVSGTAFNPATWENSTANIWVSGLMLLA